MKKSGKSLDWAGARARLDEIRRSLEQAEKPALEEVRAVYRERARHLKVPEVAIEAPGAANRLLVFRLGEERYALPASMLVEILKDVNIAPVPGAPPSVAGLIQVRGEIRPVYDLARQIGAARTAEGAGFMLLLREGRRDFAVTVDAVEEIRMVMENEPKQAGQKPRVAWVTGDLVSVLNGESLWRNR